MVYLVIVVDDTLLRVLKQDSNMVSMLVLVDVFLVGSAKFLMEMHME